LYFSRGEYEQARECYSQALSIRREIGDRWGEGRSLKNLGRVYIALEQKKTALEHLALALSTCREIGDRWGEAKALDTIGTLKFYEGSHNIALASFLLARDIHDELQSVDYPETQNWIEKIQNALGDEQFSTLLLTVEPQVQLIVDQALNSWRAE
jgi:tetratricopeptide (TPR) repeat protein